MDWNGPTAKNRQLPKGFTILPAIARSYLLTALGGTPAVLTSLLGGVGPEDLRWDAHPDPERFSLREIAAHLALIEPSW